MVVDEQQFTVRVKDANFIPDDAALREFLKQLGEAFAQDPALQSRFEDDPRMVLSERGVSLDLQRELLVSSGIAGSEEFDGVSTCPFTCLFTDNICGSGGGSGNTVILHAAERGPDA